MEWQWGYHDSPENKSIEVERKWIQDVSKSQLDISHTHSSAVCHYERPQCGQQMTAQGVKECQYAHRCCS